MIAARAAMAIAALSSGIAAAQSCGGDLAVPVRTVEGERYVVAFATQPTLVVVGEHFVVDFAVCPRGGSPAPAAVRIDATMPEHRHGMNYEPRVTRVQAGLFRAEGLMFHMGGRWDLTFDVVTATGTDRLTATLRIE